MQLILLKITTKYTSMYAFSLFLSQETYVRPLQENETGMISGIDVVHSRMFMYINVIIRINISFKYKNVTGMLL